MTFAAVAPSARAPSAPRPAISPDRRSPSSLLVAVGLDPHDQPDVAREHVAVDDVGQRHVGVEQHRARVAADGVDEVGLERALLLGRARHAERVEHVDERLAVIGGDDGEAVAGRPDLLQGPALGRGQGGGGDDGMVLTLPG